jgi:hypothetical protein
MLQRFVQLKQTILQFSGDDTLPAALTANEWSIATKLLAILEPFFILTRKLSSEECLLSTVIPDVLALQRYLSKIGNNDAGVQTTKQELLNSLQERFLREGDNNLLRSKPHVLATIVDPRFKLKYFSGEDNIEIAKSWLMQELEKIFSDPDVDNISDNEVDQEVERLEARDHDNAFESCHDEIEVPDVLPQKNRNERMVYLTGQRWQWI